MIKAENLHFRIGNFAMKGVSFEVRNGEYFVLLGPPGSGKTLLLESLCGLRKLESGRIHIQGKDVTDLEPRRRMIGYVPQDYALFPHLDVEGNIRFGLEARGLPAGEKDRRVGDIADQLGMRHLLRRRVQGLSGGERQQTALARALVTRPKVLLLDEPVSALDESTREAVCRELKRIQGDLGIATIHVCHQLQEAFSVADRAGILRQGVFQQSGSMRELTQKPCSRFVAEFMRCQNIIPARATASSDPEGMIRIEAGVHRFTVPGNSGSGDIRIVIRPEAIRLDRGGPARNETLLRIPAVVNRIADMGGYVRVEIDASFPLIVHLACEEASEMGLASGTETTALIRPDTIHILYN